MRIYLSILAINMVLALCLAPLVQAQDDVDVTEITQRLQQRYEDMASFQSEFTQILTNASSGESEERSGTLYYMKPQLVRWETVSPENELLIVGQDAVWDYFADEEVAYKYALADVLESKTILRFISGQADLEDEFYVESEGEEDGLTKLLLLPLEPEPQLVEAHLWVDPDTGMFSRILLMDFYGNGNELIFNDLQQDPELTQDMFRFDPPEGVDVFDNTESMAVPVPQE